MLKFEYIVAINKLNPRILFELYPEIMEEQFPDIPPEQFEVLTIGVTNEHLYPLYVRVGVSETYTYWGDDIDEIIVNIYKESDEV